MALINYLTRIQFDFGALALLPEEMKLIGMSRPLVITDRGVVAAGLLDRVTATLPASVAVATFDGTPANPTERAALVALDAYRAHGADGIIAVGGGSSMDLAKAVAILATHEPPLVQYAAAEGGVARITAKVAPIIAIPTTAGTGSEVGRGAIIIFNDGRKIGLLSPHLLPRLALCDPELTLGLPAGITAGTGMDALTHCVETFLSPNVNPPADAIALDGARRAARHLVRAVENGQDREARWNMMMAAMEGAMAFQKGLGAVHSMSHPLGSLEELKLHHGTLNAVILPTILRWNDGHVGDKYDRLCEAMDLPAGTDLARHVEQLNARIGLPDGLKAMGVPTQVLPRLSEAAIKDHCHLTTPRQPTVAEYEALFLQAM
ncbi:iron-containing alcohol dehydrogenase [Allostella vacuolata]|nr:iron-containing alcohol dehydrogenase [Stella vacuolata]